MGLTKRQTETIEQIIIQESRSAAASQQERHRILSGMDDEVETVTEVKGRELSDSVVWSLDSLMETFVRNNQVYEGVEFDNGKARAAAQRYLRRLIENDLKEVQQMLQDGDFDDVEG